MNGAKPGNVRRKWRRWLARLNTELTTLVISNEIFRRTAEIVRRNPSIQRPADFHRWLVRSHGVASLVAVRRLMDRRKDVVSLRRLLDDIASNHSALTRGSYVSFFEPDLKAWAHDQFDEIAGPASQNLPGEVPKRDLVDLQKRHERIRHLVNQQLAHLDARNLRRKPPSAHDLEDVVGAMESTFLKYQTLLTGKAASHLLPTWQYDWTEIFGRPWLVEENGGACQPADHVAGPAAALRRRSAQ